MGWQDRFRELGEELTSGRITTDEYRRRSAEILAEADRESEREAERKRVHIPRSAAWEAPSGEMTQLVGARDDTTLVKLASEGGSAESRDEPEGREN
ncbi:hypothetical protein [Actinophytocola xanthii]|uniref:SHOCT domain-containing protein n=1 Tax=Actinophytocola xanthii TaxID=1912961 RepID=A0A1Q8CVH2_9PSEU|nr:hypothetical protein [Actinophytocola xanthii]OLF18349.1 hypothetical protein BU204_07370 [Actinophytocola xanthii]